MISTEKVSAVTSLTVSETPSSATEPLVRDETHQLARRAQREPRHVGQVLARDQLGDAVDVAGDDMAAELVADLQRAFEIEPACPASSPRPWSAAASRRRHRPRTGAVASAPVSTTVRQTPDAEIDAPIAIELRG